jgi:hypothetical protein
MLKNPITHIVFFGLLLALILLIVNGPPMGREEERRVVITDSDIEQLRISWMRQWQRPPTDAELRGLIERYVREEVLYREALARGFDKDDLVVRRTMQRKMEYLGESQVQREVPDDNEVKAYYALRSEQYRVDPELSFAQVYISTERPTDDIDQAVQQTLVRLRTEKPDLNNLADYGDRFMLQNHYTDQIPQQVRSQFGEAFAEALMSVEPDSWQGPVESGYGLHLVYVYDRKASYIPDLENIAARVIDDIQNEARNSARELFYIEILRNYEVIYGGNTVDLLAENATESETESNSQ